MKRLKFSNIEFIDLFIPIGIVSMVLYIGVYRLRSHLYFSGHDLWQSFIDQVVAILFFLFTISIVLIIAGLMAQLTECIEVKKVRSKNIILLLVGLISLYITYQVIGSVDLGN